MATVSRLRIARLLLGRISVLCLALLPIAAQTLPPTLLKFRSYGVEDGLGHLDIQGLGQDRQGFLLAATPVGIFRHNGRGWSPFGEALGLPRDRVSKFWTSRDGRMVVVTEGKTWFTHGDRFAPLQDAPRNIYDVAFGPTGEILLCNNHGALLAPKDRAFQALKGLPEGRLSTAVFQGGDLWMVHRAKDTSTLLLLREGKLHSHPLPERIKDSVTAMVIDRQGTFWLRGYRFLLRAPGPEGPWEDLAPNVPWAFLGRPTWWKTAREPCG